MSSTYVHYSAASSLPSDYAVLTRFAAARGIKPDQPADAAEGDEDDSTAMQTDDVNGMHTSEESPLMPNKRPRRSSFPTAYVTPFNPTSMGPLPDKTGHRSGPAAAPPNENTPLLAPLVPRIPEEVDGEDLNPESGDRPNVIWEEIRILTKYALPVCGTHLLEYSLVIASVISIGHLSTTALAASTLGSMTASVSGYSITQGFSSTLDTMLPSAWTSSQPQLVGLWSQRMAVVMAACLFPITLIWFNSEAILLGLKQEPEVARLAAIYLKWASLGLPAYAFNGISRRYFQSQGLFAVPTRIIMCVAPINALLNWFLVWGPEPVRLGFIGAPIATAISFNLIAFCSVIYGVWFVPHTAWHPICRRSFTSLGVLVQLGLAGVGQTASEWWSWELVGLAASMLGPIQLATQSVLLVSASTTFQAPFALGVATSVRIGNLLGEENALRASYVVKAAMLMSLAIGIIWSTMFMVFRNTWGHLFNDDADVVGMVSFILPIVALFQVFDGLGAVTAGILRAEGKQFTGALLNLSAYYVIGIPFGLWLAFNRHWDLLGLWIGLTIALVYESLISMWICLRTDWDYQVAKVRARLEAEHKAGVRRDAEAAAAGAH